MPRSIAKDREGELRSRFRAALALALTQGDLGGGEYRDAIFRRMRNLARIRR